MNKLLKWKRMLVFFGSFCILAALSVIFWYVWEHFYSGMIMMPFYRKGHWLMVAVYGMLLFAFTRIYGGYRIGYFQVAEVIYSQMLALLFTNLVTYLQICLIGRYFMWVVPILIMTAAQISLVILWAFGANYVYYHFFPPRKLVLVYGSHAATRLVYKMSKRSDRYLICSAISTKEGFDAVVARISEYSGAILCDVKSDLRNKIIKYCYEKSIRVYITPKLSDIIIGGADKIHLFDTPLFLCRNKGLSLDQRIMKRALDLLVSTVALLLLSPLMLLVSLCIWLYDRGPVFFKQKRLTLNGKVFEVYKFRSMIVNAEEDGVARLACQHDQRITPIGKVMRAVRLDELPQIINVFKGEMSIVGPRPERPELVEEYRESMPEFDFRLKVKAGLTGYAQILGKYNTVPYDKLKMDLIYIQNYSMLLDLKIIMMTLKVLLIPESSEGIADGDITPIDGIDDYNH